MLDRGRGDERNDKLGICARVTGRFGPVVTGTGCALSGASFRCRRALQCRYLRQVAFRMALPDVKRQLQMLLGNEAVEGEEAGTCCPAESIQHLHACPFNEMSYHQRSLTGCVRMIGVAGIYLASSFVKKSAHTPFACLHGTQMSCKMRILFGAAPRRIDQPNRAPRPAGRRTKRPVPETDTGQIPVRISDDRGII